MAGYAKAIDIVLLQVKEECERERESERNVERIVDVYIFYSHGVNFKR